MDFGPDVAPLRLGIPADAYRRWTRTGVSECHPYHASLT